MAATQRHDAAVAPGRELPHVQIAHVAVVHGLKLCADRLHQFGVGRFVQQLPGRGAHQAEAPVQDDQRTHDAHDRVQQREVREAPHQQSHDRQHTGQRVGQHMKVGGLEVVVVVVCRVPCAVSGVVGKSRVPRPVSRVFMVVVVVVRVPVVAV